jgi:pimeloyl-ACP methyl ester carboxylesterase
LRERRGIHVAIGTEFHVAPALASSLQQPSRVFQQRAKEEADVDVILERVDIAKRAIADAGSRTSVVHQFAHVAATLPHACEPDFRERPQILPLRSEPGVDGRVVFHCCREAKYVVHRVPASVVKYRTNDHNRSPIAPSRYYVAMRRWTIRIVVVLCGVVVVLALTGAAYQWLATRRDLAAAPPPGRLVDIGGHRLHLWCTGDGAPAVVLDTGLGGTTADWGYVQPEVARFTRVCSYDRAGMGYSDPGPSPRTARRIASELAELLRREGIEGPVVLVGASIAGLDVRMFASDHPARAAGLVLVDASHEDQAHEPPRIARFAPLLAALGVFRLSDVSFGQRAESLSPSVRQFARATAFRAAGYTAAADEIIHVRESASEVRSARRKLTIPVLVVTGARGGDENWRKLQRDQASLSERGCLIVAAQSGHVVAVDQPEAVVDAIRTVVATARGEDVPLCAAPPTFEERTGLRR